MACERHRDSELCLHRLSPRAIAHLRLKVLISLPVYAYYVRRMHVLGAPLWLCITILAMAITHFSLAIVWSTKLLVSGQMTVLTLPTTLVSVLPLPSSKTLT